MATVKYENSDDVPSHQPEVVTTPLPAPRKKSRNKRKNGRKKNYAPGGKFSVAAKEETSAPKEKNLPPGRIKYLLRIDEAWRIPVHQRHQAIKDWNETKQDHVRNDQLWKIPANQREKAVKIWNEKKEAERMLLPSANNSRQVKTTGRSTDISAQYTGTERDDDTDEAETSEKRVKKKRRANPETDDENRERESTKRKTSKQRSPEEIQARAERKAARTPQEIQARAERKAEKKAEKKRLEEAERPESSPAQPSISTVDVNKKKKKKSEKKIKKERSVEEEQVSSDRKAEKRRRIEA